jgi:hypothetical protein
VQSITYVNSRGQTATFGMDAPLLLGHVDGVGELAANREQVSALGLDGLLDYGAALDARHLTITGTLVGYDREHMYIERQRLAAVMDPRLSGLLTYTNDWGSWQLAAAPEGLPSYGTRFTDHRHFLPYAAYFVCPSPYWEGIHQHTLRFGIFEGMEFRYTLPLVFANVIRRINAHNAGQTETPVQITFGGPAVNPVIVNETTGEHIKVEATVDAGSALLIDTDIRRNSVTLRASDGSMRDVLPLLSSDSVMLKLQPGDNFLHYSNDDESTTNRLTALYRDRFLGV